MMRLRKDMIMRMRITSRDTICMSMNMILICLLIAMVDMVMLYDDDDTYSRADKLHPDFLQVDYGHYLFAAVPVTRSIFCWHHYSI